MKNRYLSIAIVGTLIVLMYNISSCSDDDGPPPLTDFVAEDEDFANFRQWTQVGMRKGRVGSDTANLQTTTHQNNRDTVTRYVYIKDNATRSADGEYPVGTMVVKFYQFDDGESNGGTGMVKRGKDYNPDGGNWEWFNLDKSTPIKIARNTEGNQVRGIMAGCIGCHKAAEVPRDFVFSRQ